MAKGLRAAVVGVDEGLVLVGSVALSPVARCDDCAP